MDWRKALPVMILVILTTIPIAPGAASDYTILLQSNHFNVTWTINAWQNLTGFPTTTVYPGNLNSTLQGQDLSAFTSVLQRTLQTRVSTLSITQPTVHITSNNADNTCSTTCLLQWLNITIRLEVWESAPATSGVTRYDMSWKAVRIDDDLAVAGVGFNRVGERYLLNALAPFVNFQPTRSRSLTLTVQNQTVGVANYQGVAGGIVLLDTSAFQTPLDNWGLARDLFLGAQTWTSPHSAGFSVSAVFTISEPGSTTSLHYVAGSQVSARLSAPLNTFALGDTLFVDNSRGLGEQIGVATILGSLGLLIGSIVLERRITSRPGTRGRSRKNR